MVMILLLLARVRDAKQLIAKMKASQLLFITMQSMVTMR